MNNFMLLESSIHYVTALLDRETVRYPIKHHIDALKDFRYLSDKLLERLEEPVSVNIFRHEIKDKER